MGTRITESVASDVRSEELQRVPATVGASGRRTAAIAVPTAAVVHTYAARMRLRAKSLVARPYWRAAGISPENIAMRVISAAVEVAKSAMPYPVGESARVRYGTVSNPSALAMAAATP